MKLTHVTSLAATLSDINEALLRGREIAQAERDRAAAWIASRVGMPGSYRERLPAPTPDDYNTDLRLFTGEPVGSRVGTGCKLGFEAAWALAALRSMRSDVAAAARLCCRDVIALFAQESARRRGMYCCHSCSVAGWRALGIAPAASGAALLGAGLTVLRSARDGKGRWHGFPFWYTLLALHDMDGSGAMGELRYAAPVLEHTLRWKPGDDICRHRRLLLAERALARI